MLPWRFPPQGTANYNLWHLYRRPFIRLVIGDVRYRRPLSRSDDSHPFRTRDGAWQGAAHASTVLAIDPCDACIMRLETLRVDFWFARSAPRLRAASAARAAAADWNPRLRLTDRPE